MQINCNLEALTRLTSVLINYTFCCTLHTDEMETVCALANVLFMQLLQFQVIIQR
jgi:hypothetical protein